MNLIVVLLVRGFLLASDQATNEPRADRHPARLFLRG